MTSKARIAKANVEKLRLYVNQCAEMPAEVPMASGRVYLKAVYQQAFDKPQASRAPSWFTTNPEAAEQIERLRTIAGDCVAQNADQKTAKEVRQLENRITNLQVQVASLQEENASLRRQLDRHDGAFEHLLNTGRTIL